MRRVVCIPAVLLAVAGCASSGGRSARSVPPSAEEWAGVYAMPADDDGAAQLLSIVWPAGGPGRPVYRMVIRDPGGGGLDVVGVARVDGDTITLAIATAASEDEFQATRAVASVERYHFRRVNGRAVLISDEALAALRDDDDDRPIRGVLIKVSDRATLPEPGEADDGGAIRAMRKR